MISTLNMHFYSIFEDITYLLFSIKNRKNRVLYNTLRIFFLLRIVVKNYFRVFESLLYNKENIFVVFKITVNQILKN